MGKNLEALNNITSVSVSVSLPPIAELPITAKTNVGDESIRQCHGVLHDAVLVIPAFLFVLYLAVNAKKNLKKLWNGRSYIMISYYALLWLASVLNLAWCSLQSWQCSAGKEVSWNLLSLFTLSAMLYLEISLVAFLLQESYASGLETLARTFIISGIISGVDILLKVICVFGFGFPVFIDVESTHRMKWRLWIIHKLLLTAVYGFILFVHFSKWREKLPSRPAFYHYVVLMFVISAVALFGCMLAGIGAGFGLWYQKSQIFIYKGKIAIQFSVDGNGFSLFYCRLYNLSVICYHLLYLPFLYVTFLADFFQEEDFLLDNAYYSEMKDAGFFDADWE